MLDYNYFRKHYKLTGIDLSKQQLLNGDQKALQEINFTGNVDRNNGATIFFMIEEAKEMRFFTGNCKSILILFFL